MAMSVILVVDDEALVRELTVAMLTSMEFSVLEASSGADALILLSDHPEIALIVLDIRMPQMDGIEVFRRARRIRPLIPIIFASAYTEFEGTIRALPETLLLTKPFGARQLLARLASLGFVSSLA